MLIISKQSLVYATKLEDSSILRDNRITCFQYDSCQEEPKRVYY